MSEQASSPVLTAGVDEVQGIFPSDEALQRGIAQLTLAGFDRADLSLPSAQAPGAATPETGAADPMTDTDIRQARTMGTSMAGTVGALAAAGATIATGGAAAVALAAAAAVGGGAALAAASAGNAAGEAQSGERDEAALKGQLILAVHATTPDKRADAERILQAAGATLTASVRREGNAVIGIDSTSWTG